MKLFAQLFDAGKLAAGELLLARTRGGLKFSSARQNQILFASGLVLLIVAMTDSSFAIRTTNYNDQRLTEAINAVLSYLEGSFGALVMVCAGVGAILSAAFGQYRASLGLLVVAIGSFILRSLMSTFFNDVGIQE